MSNVTIHWFRKALRLHDNAALLKAVESGGPVIPLYVLDAEYLNPEKMGVNRLGFLLDTLKSLDEDLRERGSRLFVAKGNPLEVLESFIGEYQAKQLTFEKETAEPYNIAIDAAVAEMSQKHGVTVHACSGHTLYDPEYLLGLNQGKCPRNIEEFLKIISYADPPAAPLKSPNQIPAPPSASSGTKRAKMDNGVPSLSELSEFGYANAEKSTWFIAGERVAIKRMEEFLSQTERVATFEKDRTAPTSLGPDTTALSPYLAHGSLSVRLFYARLKESLGIAAASDTKTPISLEGQIYWRDLVYLIAATTPNFAKMEGNPRCTQINWVSGAEGKALADKWEFGQTGHPAVDAAMNQLRTDGWMHHLARHLVACFLTRGDLWVHWGLGRDVFERYLLDSDWSVNNYHWQTSSAFSHTVSPIFDPSTYFKETDPSGAYVRRHVPALRNFPEEYIYEPWKASKDVQEVAGCLLGQDYPNPIVDHHMASKANMDKMSVVYANLH